MVEISSDSDSDTSYAIGENNDSEFSDEDLEMLPRKSKNKKRNGLIINDVGSPSRHGKKDSNYNELISTLSGPSTSSKLNSSPNEIVQNKDNVVIINDSPQTPVNNPTKNSPDLLQLILKKLDAIENFLIRLDVKVNVMDGVRPRGNVSDNRLGVISLNDLKTIGVPVSDCDGLNQILEQKINDNGEFRTTFVS